MRKLTASLLLLLTASVALALNPGDLVVTEIMQNPSAVSDPNGEWFEVYNATDGDVDLNGLTVTQDGGGNIFVIEGMALLPAGEYALFAYSDDPAVNGGLPTVDYDYPNSTSLGNSDDEIFIIDTDGTTIIDEVWWDNGVTFPDPNGNSMALSDLEADNNVGANWYEETVHTYGLGDYGSPGYANDDAPDPYPVIADVTQTPGFPGSSDDVLIEATVTDVGATMALVSVDLIYDVDGGPETTLAMTATGDLYDATIPAQPAASVVAWRIEATDDFDQTTIYAGGYTVEDIPTVSIYDIQYTEDPGVDGTYPSPYDGQTVTITGLVTALAPSGTGSFFVQDAESAWSGIQVYGTNAGVAVNDEVIVTGPVTEYYGQSEILISGPEAYTVLSSGNTPVEPVILPLLDAFGEAWESVLVRVEGSTCSALPDGYNTWQITDGTNTGYVDDLFDVIYTPTLDECYDIQGMMYYAYDLYRLNPRELGEITLCGGANTPPVINDMAHLPLLPTSTDAVTVSATISDNIGVDHADLYYNVDGGGDMIVAMTADVDLYSGIIPAQADGSVVEYYIVATDTPEGDTSATDPGTYAVVDVWECEDIANIRANDADGVPLMDGQGAMVCGVLTVGHEFGASGPAYLTGPTGSVAVHDGVFGDDTQLVIGDEVEVIGIVGAFNGLTQIQNSVIINDLGFVGEPTPVTMTLADLNLDPEAYEAQLLRVEGVTLVDPENWPLEGDFATVTVQQGVETFAMYIDRDTAIDGTTAPTEPFDLIGVMSQYDNSLPWTEGYNISPRNLDDVGMGYVPPVVTIYDIQYTEDPGGDSPLLGQEVITGGIVYGLVGDYAFFLQDADGPWNGIYVYGSCVGLTIGDEIEVTGTVEEYYNLTEFAITSEADYTILSSGNTPYAATVGTIPDLYQEMYEGVFVAVENVTCSNPDLGYGEWEISDGTNLGVIDEVIFEYLPVLDECFELIQGAMNYTYSNFKIAPRMAEDIVNCGGLDAPVVTISYAAATAQLSWEAVDGAIDYRVHFSTEPYSGWDAGTLTGGLTTYSMPATGQYYFYVVALDE